MNHHLPPKEIYKYRDAKWGLEILRSKNLYYSSPLSFEDSKDCNLNLMSFDKPSNSKIEEILNRTNYNRKEKRKKIWFYKHNPKEFGVIYQENFEQLLSKTRVSCFSKRPDIKRLWKEYADNGKGICIRFNSRIEIDVIIPKEVTYYEKLPSFNFFEFDNEKTSILDFFTCKLKSKYGFEEEIRLFHFNEKKLVHFSPDLIEEVILGKNISEEIENEVFNLLKEPCYSKVLIKKVIDDNPFVKLSENIILPTI